MKTAIVYTTTHGCAEKCVNELRDKLTGDIDIFNIKNSKSKNLDTYERVIVGGSIHAGQIQRRIKSFCEKNEAILLEKKLGLFLCCMEEGDKAQEEFDNAYPESLRSHATALGFFGGEFDFDKMGFLAKTIVKKVANVEQSVSKISHENIAAFAEKMS